MAFEYFVISVIPACTSTLPANNRETLFIVNLNGTPTAGSIQGSDFKVNGIGADNVSGFSNTANFTFNKSAVWIGVNTMSIAAGAFSTTIEDPPGVFTAYPINAFSCTFQWPGVAVPNMVLVPSIHGTNVANALIIARTPSSWAINWREVPCVDGVGADHILINAALRGRHFITEPFSNLSNPMLWGTFDFAPGYLNRKYREQWYLENVSHPITFAMDSGSLPPGLRLTTVDNMGQISGIPTRSGKYAFSILANSPGVSGSKFFHIIVSDPGGGSGFIYGN
jgi:hypothetical protein